MTKRKTGIAALTLASLCFSLFFSANSAALASTTLGNGIIDRPNLDTYANFSIVGSISSPFASGSIATFSYFATNTSPFRFLVTDASNTVKWISEAITPSMIGANTYTPSTTVPFRIGERLGIHFTATASIPFTATGTNIQYTANNYGVPGVGNVLAIEGSQARTYSVAVAANDNIMLPAPTFTAPANNAKIFQASTTKIAWTTVTGSSTYLLEAFSDANYASSTYMSGWLGQPEATLVNLAAGSYFIRVKAKDSNGNESAWSNGASSPYLFTVIKKAVATSTKKDLKDQCKNHGWKNFLKLDNRKFKNQGDCISYAISKGKFKLEPKFAAAIKARDAKIAKEKAIAAAKAKAAVVAKAKTAKHEIKQQAKAVKMEAKQLKKTIKSETKQQLNHTGKKNK